MCCIKKPQIKFFETLNVVFKTTLCKVYYNITSKNARDKFIFSGPECGKCRNSLAFLLPAPYDRNKEKPEGTGMEIQLGDVLTLKKQHPCGSRDWEVLRVGMDFRLKCTGCDHQVMIPRRQLEKNIKKITPGAAAE